jgi:hypothetical protein
MDKSRYQHDPIISTSILKSIQKEGQRSELIWMSVYAYCSTKISRKISKSHFSKNMKYLKEHNLIYQIHTNKKLKNGHQEIVYKLTNLGKICLKNRYDPSNYLRFVKLSQMICVAALFGVSVIKKRKNNSIIEVGDAVIINPATFVKNKSAPADYYHIEERIRKGVSKKDLIDKIYHTSQANYLYLNYTENEIDHGFNILKEKKTIKPFTDNDEERYCLYDQKMENFISRCWTNIVNWIHFRIEIKAGYLFRNLDKSEKDWLTDHLGKKRADNLIKNWVLSKRYWKKEGYDFKNSKYKDHYIKILKKQTEQILGEYNYLNVESKKVFSNFTEIGSHIMALVCPKELFDNIKSDSKKLVLKF